MPINVAVNVLRSRPEGFTQNVRVRDAADDVAARAALDAASRRFMMVTVLGQELTAQDWERLVAEGREDEIYTPNYVSHVEHSDDGPFVDIDCKDEATDAMRQKFVDIVVEELTKHGVGDGTIDSFDPDSPWNGVDLAAFE